MFPDEAWSMDLTNRSTATSYHFSTNPRSWGWAICTVNDQTGELNVMSDWGNWAYRWHTGHIGAPSLTHFIGDRSSDGRHYLADKLTSDDRSKRYRFAPDKTVAELRRHLLEKRRALEVDAELARGLWDELGDLEHCDDASDFASRFYDIEHHDKITRYSLDCLREELTGSYLVLRDKIIPALIAACNATIAERDRARQTTQLTAAPVQ